MTQTTQSLIEAHEDELAFNEDRSYQRTPRPFRRADRAKKGRRNVALTANGRNASRSTLKSFSRSKQAAKLGSQNM